MLAIERLSTGSNLISYRSPLLVRLNFNEIKLFVNRVIKIRDRVCLGLE